MSNSHKYFQRHLPRLIFLVLWLVFLTSVLHLSFDTANTPLYAGGGAGDGGTGDGGGTGSGDGGVADAAPDGCCYGGDDGGGGGGGGDTTTNVTCNLTLTPNPANAQNVTLTWSNGINPMAVTRNGSSLGNRSSGWIDTSAAGLSSGSYVYTVTGSVSTQRQGECDKFGCATYTDTTNYACSNTLTVSAPRPDLTTSNVTLNSGTLTAGVALTFNGTVQNSGVAATGAGFTDRFRYRIQTGTFLGIPIWSGWTSFSTVAQSALAVSASAINTSGAIQFASAGNVQIEFCGDSGSVITESNESNNCATQQFVIAAAPSGPTVTSCTASPNPSTTGQSVMWTANVTGGQAPLSYSWTGTDGLGGTYAINTVSHTYNSAGTKNATVNVTDNLGQSSGAYDCSALTVNTPPTPTVDFTIREVGTGSWGPSVTVDAGDDVELQWSSTGADRCVGDSYFSTGSGQPADGTQQTVSEPASGARVYQVTCYDDDAGTQASDTVTVNVNAPSGNPDLNGSPSRVQQGDEGSFDFDTGGHTNCVITGTNGDVFDLTALYPGQQTGTVTTSPIVGETIYTMQCDLASTETTIRIFPVFEEI